MGKYLWISYENSRNLEFAWKIYPDSGVQFWSTVRINKILGLLFNKSISLDSTVSKVVWGREQNVKSVVKDISPEISLHVLKVHKNENFFGSDFEICTFS